MTPAKSASTCRRSSAFAAAAAECEDAFVPERARPGPAVRTGVEVPLPRAETDESWGGGEANNSSSLSHGFAE